MDQQILDFLSHNHVGVLTTLLRDGSPHSAVLHYSHTVEPLAMYFSTDSTSRKCEALNESKAGKAAVVIGFSAQEWVTFQLDGDVELLTDRDKIVAAQQVHYAKHPHSEKYKDDSKSVFLRFTPKWWRFTDFNAGPKIVGSN